MSRETLFSRLRCRSVATAFWFAAAVIVQASALPVARPSDVGLSAERLGRLSRVMQEYIDQGRIPGMVTLISREGCIAYFRAFGQLDRDRGIVMPTNAIFRIASQTKAVTSVAVLMLQEEGRLLLDDPVSKYVAEFASARVAVQASGQDVRGYATVPLKRPITIRDLLTHTAGISYGDGPAKEEYLASGIYGWFLADKPMPIGEVIRKLTALPFDAQPGERFVYGLSLIHI